MGRLCTMCVHPQRLEREREIMQHTAGYRVAGSRYRL